MTNQITSNTELHDFLEIPIYRYRVVGGDFRNPKTQEFQEGDFYLDSPKQLEDCSDDFRSYTLVGIAGKYCLDSRWRKTGYGYSNGQAFLDMLDLDEFDGYLPSEGVTRINYEG